MWRFWMSLLLIAPSVSCLPTDEQRCASARKRLYERLPALRAKLQQERDRATRQGEQAEAKTQLSGSYRARASRASQCLAHLDAAEAARAAGNHAEASRQIHELMDCDRAARGHVVDQQRSVDKYCR